MATRAAQLISNQASRRFADSQVRYYYFYYFTASTRTVRAYGVSMT